MNLGGSSFNILTYTTKKALCKSCVLAEHLGKIKEVLYEASYQKRYRAKLPHLRCV